MSEERDTEIDEIVRKSAATAEALYPKRGIGIRMRIIIFVAALILVGTGVLSIVNSAVLNQEKACQTSQNSQITALRNSNTSATSNWINGIAKSIQSGKISTAVISDLTKQYNNQVADNNSSIDKIRATQCQ